MFPIPHKIKNSPAMAMNQPGIVFATAAGPRNPWLIFAVAIRHLHLRAMFGLGRPLDDFWPHVNPARIRADSTSRWARLRRRMPGKWPRNLPCPSLLIPDDGSVISDTVELLAPTTFRVRPHEQGSSEFIACLRCESVCLPR